MSRSVQLVSGYPVNRTCTDQACETRPFCYGVCTSIGGGGGTCPPTNFQGGGDIISNVPPPPTILGLYDYSLKWGPFFHVSSPPALCGLFFCVCLSERLVICTMGTPTLCLENWPQIFEVRAPPPPPLSAFFGLARLSRLAAGWKKNCVSPSWSGSDWRPCLDGYLFLRPALFLLQKSPCAAVTEGLYMMVWTWHDSYPYFAFNPK